jgi:hypothetical protein
MQPEEKTPNAAGRNAYIHLALRRLGLVKATVCGEFSGNQAFRLSHLTAEEHREVYEFCKKEMIASGHERPSAFRPKEGDAQRKNVIGILMQLRVYESATRRWEFVQADGTANMTEIGLFVEAHGPCKPKTFMEYDKKELSRLVTAMENIARSHRNRKLRAQPKPANPVSKCK